MKRQGSVPSAKRWVRRKEARPQELVSAALALFVARGYAATRLEDVASAAGVSKGTVYLYFAGKEELFKAVIQENLLPVLAEGEVFIDTFEGTSEALLHEILMGWWERIGESPASGLTKLLIAESGNFPDLVQYYSVEVIERYDRLFARILARGVARGDFRETDVHQTTLALVAPMLFLKMWKHSFGICTAKALEPKVFITHVVSLLLHGLLRNPSPGAALPVPPPLTAEPSAI
ncbi:TetR family transcriptional regulator [Ralstonia sp.]|uniref:TetR family transcriptional regulator n=1 Tax=Ralstonia sp. TaxID=54061 RepID=UPI0009E2CC2F|nr:TetR/AcrR family transcriptional regulator [Ralstonia sp.]HWV05740.1 TetR/AcrR family transcriptional regulator [Ralstonia sp.]